MTKSSPDRRLVLLIDDDDLIVGSLRHYLVTQGCDVDVAVEPPAAEAMMRAKKYDVVVVDPYFTGAIHNGHGLLDSIGALQPAASTIVLTAYASPELARAVAASRATALLTKPQSVVYLSELVSAPQAAVPLPRESHA
jgi:DNA-binding NtrC family response regulator